MGSVEPFPFYIDIGIDQEFAYNGPDSDGNFTLTDANGNSYIGNSFDVYLGEVAAAAAANKCFCNGDPTSTTQDTDGDSIKNASETSLAEAGIVCFDQHGIDCADLISDVDGNGDYITTITNLFSDGFSSNLSSDHSAANIYDCDDTDSLVYPNAEEWCDGQYNDCTDSVVVSAEVSGALYASLVAPSDELDGDADTFVECDQVYTDGAGCFCTDILGTSCTDIYGVTCTPTTDLAAYWAGDSTVTGGGDCDDGITSGGTKYPGATEICDSLFNDCTNPLNPEADTGGTYHGVVADCFCEDASCQIDPDADGVSNCKDINGNVCSPTDVVDTNGNSGADGFRKSV